ncbi:thymidylate synthase [Synechococcus phage S-CBWM1]|uniref:Thymidylate synthase n=1 Tax=Synechococcus phage S-CBWM1 TaxID=2053653 RepID=A0A3G1L3Q6_9CAUD|nr:thymidylate synthase [Synechococcus phage S-CBWM1]ATW62813.1 thymidylate synthase [Synechococcus phage S-CBWM1]
MDSRFQVTVLSSTPNPQQVAWLAMHQDYSENFVGGTAEWKDEREAGRAVVKNLLANDRGHFGPLEHSQIVFGVGYFPHSVMQQARTHRVGVSFDCQSMRYTGDRIKRFGERTEERTVEAQLVELEDLFYLRPIGKYTDRQGKKYEYTAEMREEDLLVCFRAAKEYAHRLNLGYSEEHARGILPFDFRQHFVVSFTMRALMHFLDLRAKKDAQLEIQQLCELMVPRFEIWAPEIALWYEEKRLGKARLAP